MISNKKQLMYVGLATNMDYRHKRSVSLAHTKPVVS